MTNQATITTEMPSNMLDAQLRATCVVPLERWVALLACLSVVVFRKFFCTLYFLIVLERATICNVPSVRDTHLYATRIDDMRIGHREGGERKERES